MTRAVLHEEIDALLDDVIKDPRDQMAAKKRLRERMAMQETVRIFPTTRFASDSDDFFDNLPV